MKLKNTFIVFLKFSVTAILLFLSLVFMGWLVRPNLTASPRTYSEEEIQAAIAVRNPQLDANNPPVIHVEVDYRQGKKAAWYPKGESPLLAELVAEGKLPPVAQRVGSEPCVLKGIEGIGKYGGTWIRMGNPGDDNWVMGNCLSGCTLLRWSPQGYPLVPHVAKSYHVSPDNKEFTFELREGMRWSDGEPFTADDILYWWENDVNDPSFGEETPPWMLIRGKRGKVEKLGPYTVKFSFPEPNGIFPSSVATFGDVLCNRPAHFLRKYHPRLGDPKLIQSEMENKRLSSPQAVYRQVLYSGSNPEYPRLWPWVYRTYRSNPPQQYVRNPYYWVVDEEGNQLPYVDRVLHETKSMDMIAVSMSNGEGTCQDTHMDYRQYTLLMEQRKNGEYDLYHWYPSTRGLFVISPNLNRRIDPKDPSTTWKHQLMNDKRFRQALSLAINRKDIITAEYNGLGEPAQAAPGPDSFFYNADLYHAFTEYDPERANQLLDEIGLTKRDYEGFRTFPDGTKMTFIFSVGQWTGPDQFVVRDWAKVGVRAVIRTPGGGLFYAQKMGLTLDFSSWGGGDSLPLLGPSYLVPYDGGCSFAVGYGLWYAAGGFYGNPEAENRKNLVAPPPDHPLRRAMQVYEDAKAESDMNRQKEIMDEALSIAAENLWMINISTAFPQIAFIKNGFRNVPRVLAHSWYFHSPANGGVETFYFENPYNSPGALEQIKNEMITVTPAPSASSAVAAAKASGTTVETWLRRSFTTVFVLLLLMVAVRHPYIGRRLLIMVPMLLIISILTFAVIQMPPGDFLSSRIMQLEALGRQADMKEIDELRKMFNLDVPMLERYTRWMGLNWFIPSKIPVNVEMASDGPTGGDSPAPRKEKWTCFREEDKGLIQGYMGLTMDTLRPVSEVMGERLLLTVLISLGTILMTWSLAVPIGIYSAVRQYSPSDYVLTFIGFIGMCVPSFLVALLLMYFSKEFLGVSVSGLFSSQFSAQPEWDWPKVLDLGKHIWVPIVVLGIGGTAGMIRVMRANLLDELKKPYVTTARAKGVRPVKLLLKYPVRLALNPFISGIGGIFPEIISGGAIVSIVLSLPTIGPMMLSGLLNQDMYMAGSLLMLLSLLGIIGTLVSDLLLLWLDPRIRYEGNLK